eukprot:4718384-Lingulodinium_polyedra.AAC.1
MNATQRMRLVCFFPLARRALLRPLCTTAHPAATGARRPAGASDSPPHATFLPHSPAVYMPRAMMMKQIA